MPQLDVDNCRLKSCLHFILTDENCSQICHENNIICSQFHQNWHKIEQRWEDELACWPQFAWRLDFQQLKLDHFAVSSDRHNSRQSAAECSEALACDWSGLGTWPPARAPIGPDGSRGFLIPTPENCARMQNKLDLIWNYQLQNRGSGQILNLDVLSKHGMGNISSHVQYIFHLIYQVLIKL